MQHESTVKVIRKILAEQQETNRLLRLILDKLENLGV
jgi:ferritin